MSRNLNKDNQELQAEILETTKFEQFDVKIEQAESGEVSNSNSLKVITNVCQNPFKNSTITQKPSQKTKNKTKRQKSNMKPTKCAAATTTANCMFIKEEIALAPLEEQINHTAREPDQITSIKHRGKVSKIIISDCKASVGSESENSGNLLELNRKNGRRPEDVAVRKENSVHHQLEMEKKTDTKEESTKPYKNNLSDSESDDLQEFLNAFEPKRSKYKARQQPQLTEEQKAENERKKLERRTCTICNIVFAYPGGLRNHTRSKHTLEKPYSCEICGEQFSIQSSYSLHKRRHLGIKPHLCNLCGKTYLRKMDLRIHMQIHIPSKDKIRDVKCNYCSNVYTSKINLRKHVLTKHTDPAEWKHECSICNKKCFSATDLTHHTRQHNDDRKFKCVICGRGFFTKQNMSVHVRTHSASTSFNCQHCSNGYRSNEALQRHMLKMHGIGEEKPASAPTLFCHICKGGFRQRARLEQHLILHETGVEEYPYQCKRCDRKYKARNYFTIHMMDKHSVFIDDDYFKTNFKGRSLKNEFDHEDGDSRENSDMEY